MCFLSFAVGDKAQELQTPEEKFPPSSENLGQSKLQSFFSGLQFYLLMIFASLFLISAKLSVFILDKVLEDFGGLNLGS